MKKIIASILAAFFVLLSPLSAFASTTAQIYSLSPQSYSVSPLSVTDEDVSSGYCSLQSYVFNSDRNYNSDGFGHISQLTFFDINNFISPYTGSGAGSGEAGLSALNNSKTQYYYLILNTLSADSSQLIDKGDEFIYSLSNVYVSFNASFTWSAVNVGGGLSNTTGLLFPSNASNFYFVPIYDDGTYESYELSPSDYTIDGQFISFNYAFSTDRNIDTLQFRIAFPASYVHSALSSSLSNAIGGGYFDSWTGISYVINFQDSILKVSVGDITDGLLEGIIEWLRSIRDGITGVVDSIIQLPNKIKDMLIGLIVPDSDALSNKYTEFSALLEEKLGVIYQIPMMLFDFFDTIVNAATTPQTTLTLPAFTLPWIDGSQLTIWNSLEYKIIPDGLDVLSDLIKTVTSMTVVVLTFNSVKRAYERFIRS